jgi:hypothetical protein
MFEIFTGPQLAAHYQCRWLDWSDPDNRITVDASDLDIEVVQALAKRHGHGPRLGQQLERILHPRLQRRTDEETGAQFDGFADWEWASWWRTPSPSLWPFPTMSGSDGGTTSAMREDGSSKEQSGSGADEAGSPSSSGRIHDPAASAAGVLSLRFNPGGGREAV